MDKKGKKHGVVLAALTMLPLGVALFVMFNAATSGGCVRLLGFGKRAPTATAAPVAAPAPVVPAQQQTGCWRGDQCVTKSNGPSLYFATRADYDGLVTIGISGDRAAAHRYMDRFGYWAQPGTPVVVLERDIDVVRVRFTGGAIEGGRGWMPASSLVATP